MKKDKFLTVFVVFDEATEALLHHTQKEIIKKHPYGTQTMGIPFHISLGSFPLEKKEELMYKMKTLAQTQYSFDVTLTGIGDFNHQVLFMEPLMNEALQKLHTLFEGNYADGYPWHPHVTLYCGLEEEVLQIKKELQSSFQKMTVKITGIQLGEFFPTKMLAEENFL